jgi:hypothetical protein
VSATSTVESIKNPKQAKSTCSLRCRDELRKGNFSTTAAPGQDPDFYFLFYSFGKTPPMFWICARLAGAAVGIKRKC